jgi:hypothetical protein
MSGLRPGANLALAGHHKKIKYPVIYWQRWRLVRNFINVYTSQTMKKIAIVIGLFITILSAGAQAPVPAGNGVALPRPPDFLALKETGHNFGKIPQGRPAVYVFEIMNTGLRR